MTRFTYSSKPFFWALGIMGSPIRNPAVRIFSDSLRKYFLTASGRKTKMTLAKNIQSAEEYNHCLDQRFVQRAPLSPAAFVPHGTGRLNCWEENVQPPIPNGLTENPGNNRR